MASVLLKNRAEENSTFNIEITQTCYVNCELNVMCVEWNCHYFLLFFSFLVFCLFLFFCLLVLPYYVVNKEILVVRAGETGMILHSYKDLGGQILYTN